MVAAPFSISYNKKIGRHSSLMLLFRDIHSAMIIRQDCVILGFKGVLHLVTRSPGKGTKWHHGNTSSQDIVAKPNLKSTKMNANPGSNIIRYTFVGHEYRKFKAGVRTR